MKLEIYLLKAKFLTKLQIKRIYQLYLEAYQASTFPISGLWTESHFITDNEQEYFILAQVGDEIRGFLYFSCINEEELEIWNLSVAPASWGKGLSDQIIDFLQVSSGLSFERIHLEVHEKNAAALALYQRKNWKITRRRKNYYQDQGDAVLMTYFQRK